MNAITREKHRDHYGPCTNCQTPTSHRLQLCEACRKTKCKECGKEWVFKANRREACPECKKRREKRANNYWESL